MRRGHHEARPTANTDGIMFPNVQAASIVRTTENTITRPPIRGMGTEWILRSPGKSTAPMTKANFRTSGLHARERINAKMNKAG